jgi:hypothetical protein
MEVSRYCFPRGAINWGQFGLSPHLPTRGAINWGQFVLSPHLPTRNWLTGWKTAQSKTQSRVKRRWGQGKETVSETLPIVAGVLAGFDEDGTKPPRRIPLYVKP